MSKITNNKKKNAIIYEWPKIGWISFLIACMLYLLTYKRGTTMTPVEGYKIVAWASCKALSFLSSPSFCSFLICCYLQFPYVCHIIPFFSLSLCLSIFFFSLYSYTTHKNINIYLSYYPLFFCLSFSCSLEWDDLFGQFVLCYCQSVDDICKHWRKQMKKRLNFTKYNI